MLGESEQKLLSDVPINSEKITLALTRYKLGQSLAKQGRWEAAIAQYQKALELDPNLSEAQAALDQALAQSETTAQTAIVPSTNTSDGNLIPEQTPEGRRLRKQCQQYARQGQWEEAANTLQQLITVEPSFEAYRDLGRVQARLKQPLASAQCWYQAFSLKPEKPSAKEHLQLGNTFAKQEQWEKAIACYNWALERDPKLFEAHRNLGAVFARQEKWGDAVAAYRKALALNSDSAIVHKELARALEHQEDWGAAIAAYWEAMIQDPQDLSVSEQLLKLLAKQQDWYKLEEVCRQGIAVHPRIAKFHHWLGNALLKQQREEEAVAAYQEAISLDPEFFWSHNNLGDTLLKLQRWEEAAAAYRSAIFINQDLAWTHYNLGEALIQLHRWQEAARAYRKAKSLDSHLPRINQKIGDTLRQKQQINFNSEKEEPNGNQEITEPPHPHLEKYYRALQASPNQIEDSSQVTQVYENCPKATPSNLQITENQARLLPEDASRKSLTEPISELTTQATTNQSTQKGRQISNEERDWEVRLKTAQALAIEGQIKEATECYRELISHNPEQVEVYQRVIESLYQILHLSENLTDFNLLYQLLWEHPKTAQLKLEYGRWLTSNIIYLEGTIDESWVLGKTKLILSFNENYKLAAAYFFQISDHGFAAIAVLKEIDSVLTKKNCQISVFHGSRLVKIQGHLVGEARGLQFIKYLNEKPEHPRQRIREQISQIIINLIQFSDDKKGAQEFLRKLQKFIQVPTVNLVAPNSPFSIFIDRVIPTQNRGVFISGWMYDSAAMLEEIEVISDLGFSQKLQKKDIYKYTRSDVNQFLNDNGCSVDFREKIGFCAYLMIPDEIRQAFETVADLYGFRFIVKLEGDIEYEIRPEIRQHDSHLARSTILELIDCSEVSDEMLDNCLGKASYYLQQVCAQQAGIHETLTFGKPNEHPLVSIIIPLYKCLDFIKLQFVTMAHDRALDQCELIYVLDSPEQAQEASAILSEYSALYNLPARLVIMNRNGGYACANNMGAIQARGSYLVLMNSDVVPKTKEWALDMALFYDSLPGIGTLAPKLVYEDNAIQHAGMYFEKTTFPFWLNLHYYKGFPSRYQPAQVSRPVPAVTGACLMISRDLYQQVGGLSTDYVIGDFEDSDICLKCAALGYESWYFADATLYHFERQSVPLNNNYTAGLAWRYNGRIHTQRWGDMIEKLTTKYQNY